MPAIPLARSPRDAVRRRLPLALVAVRVAAAMTTRSAFVSVVALCWLWPAVSASAQTPCDPAVPRNDSQASGYQLRGDRCEGIYKRPVASFGIQLVSLTASTGPTNICSAGGSVYMTWPVGAADGGGASVHVMAESLRPLLYYRLDVDRQPNTTSFAWPPSPRCNNDVALTASDVGILARTRMTLGARQIDVLLPVGLSNEPTTPVRPPYQAALMPGRRLREVYVSLWRYGAGATPTPVFSERALGLRPYPAGTRVTIPLSPSELTQPGLYRVRASVEFEAGEVEAPEFFFLHGR